MKDIIISASNELRRDFERQVSYMSAISKLVANSLSESNSKRVCQQAVYTLLRCDDFFRASIYLLDNNLLSCAATISIDELLDNKFKKSEPSNCMKFDIGEGVIGRVAKTREQRYIQNCSECPDFSAPTGVVAGGPRSLICTPISHEGKLIGVLNVSSNIEDDFDSWHLRFLPVFCNVLASIITNVRLIENLADQVKSAIKDAKDESTKKTNFLLSMSHDLRAPLNSIIGFTQLLQLEDTLTERYELYLGNIQKSGEHLTSLIDQILDLTGIESGSTKLERREIDIHSVCNECVSILETQAKRESIDIQIKSHMANKARILGDRVRINQVLINLLSNAIKYNKGNGGKVQVNITELPEGYILISVEDDGIGISDSKMSDVFVAFKRLAKEQSKIEGKGIGLAFSKQLIEAMNGEIGVSSKEGVGSKFWFKLPQASDAGIDISHSLMRPEDTSYALTSKYIKVLCVDDDPATIELMEAVIYTRIDNAAFLHANNVDDAMTMILVHKPDILLVDVELNGASGLELIKSVRAKSMVPIICLSGNAMPSDFAKAKKAGAIDYLVKPVDIDKLVHAINSNVLTNNE